ncbi:MAG: Rpn family recombination-promoting nuclease/putative transposase [Planctomycetia bacterium]|nr:Rpn family recombination-promoting nuclease/putative transposase [Planctomycetia bacterium]
MALFDGPPLHDFPDRAFRGLLKNQANLQEILAAAAPKQADSLDCSQAVLLDRGFVLEDWRERESDLLFRIPLRAAQPGRAALVCILLEHQSAGDDVMPLRLFVYGALYWEREWKAWQDRHAYAEPLRLSPLMPLVFHTGVTPWKHHRNLSALIAAPPFFEEFAPQWPPVFFDLAERLPDHLLDAPGPWLQALAIVRAEKEESPTFLRVFQEVLRRLEPLQDGDPVRWRDIMWFVLSWAVRRRPTPDRQALIPLVEAIPLEQRHRQEIVTMSQTTQKTWEEECAEREADIQSKSEARGQLLAHQAILRSLLEQRFQTVPAAIEQRIAMVADLQRLQAAIRQVWQVEKPEDLQF